MVLQIIGDDEWESVKPGRKAVTFRVTGIGPLRRDTRNLVVHANSRFSPVDAIGNFRFT